MPGRGSAGPSTATRSGGASSGASSATSEREGRARKRKGASADTAGGAAEGPPPGKRPSTAAAPRECAPAAACRYDPGVVSVANLPGVPVPSLWRADEKGMTAAHFAAARGDVDMLQALAHAFPAARRTVRVPASDHQVRFNARGVVVATSVTSGEAGLVPGVRVVAVEGTRVSSGSAIIRKLIGALQSSELAAAAAAEATVAFTVEGSAVGRLFSAVDHDGDTPAHLAARHNRAHAMRVLCDHGADVSSFNGLNSDGMNLTPAQIAAMCGHPDVIKALPLECLLDADVRSNEISLVVNAELFEEEDDSVYIEEALICRRFTRCATVDLSESTFSCLHCHEQRADSVLFRTGPAWCAVALLYFLTLYF